jgi:hypothetical protein
MGDELVGEAGKQSFQDLLAPREQGVNVLALRYGTARTLDVEERIPIHHNNFRVVVRQNSSREHAGDTPAQHNRASTDHIAHDTPREIGPGGRSTKDRNAPGPEKESSTVFGFMTVD